MKKIIAMTLCLVATTVTANDIDERRVLPVTEMQRNHILTEMRALLAGTQNILSALARDDMAAVARHARPLGTGMAHKGEDHMQAALPQEFMRLGMSVHKDFDQIAADAESLKNPKHTLKQLSESMNKCVACHAAYQLRITDQPEKSHAQPMRHKH
ncbi:MAG: hypothetical protein NTW90_04285 [Nitrosospira sp.]|nr:hypothetical protein [Nitrosospira sp.]